MVCDIFYVLLDLVCQYFVENFFISICQRCWPVIFFFGSVWFWYLDDAVLSLGVFPPLQSLKQFDKDQ